MEAAMGECADGMGDCRMTGWMSGFIELFILGQLSVLMITQNGGF
jgi:hypothetical protein